MSKEINLDRTFLKILLPEGTEHRCGRFHLSFHIDSFHLSLAAVADVEQVDPCRQTGCAEAGYISLT